jgi:hypothetical protein
VSPEKQTLPQIEQKALDVIEQTTFKLLLTRIMSQCQENEVVRVFEKLLCQVGLRRRQGATEIAWCHALPLM